MTIRQLFITLVITISPIIYAQTPSADLATMLNSVNTMRADFIQTVSDTKGNVAQRSYGRMSMQRPGKFRWDVIKPIPQLIIANNSRIWIYDPDLEQVTIRALTKATGETPALLLSHVDSSLDKTYDVKQMSANDMQWFVLTPRNADNMFASVQLGFAQKQIREMKLQDHLGHTTRVQFNNISTNNPISPATFVFRAPAKVDVIDETRKG